MGDDVFGVGEIRIFAGDYDPMTWLPCNGQLLPISSYELLFNAIGARFGGDGVNTFALPNLADPGPGLKYILCYTGQFISTGSNFTGTLAEVRLFAGLFLPGNWLPCNGQLLSISVNEYSEALFSLIGTKFGGDGQRTFGLPKVANPIPNVQYLTCVEGAYPSSTT